MVQITAATRPSKEDSDSVIRKGVLMWTVFLTENRSVNSDIKRTVNETEMGILSFRGSTFSTLYTRAEPFPWDQWHLVRAS